MCIHNDVISTVSLLLPIVLIIYNENKQKNINVYFVITYLILSDRFNYLFFLLLLKNPLNPARKVLITCAVLRRHKPVRGGRYRRHKPVRGGRYTHYPPVLKNVDVSDINLDIKMIRTHLNSLEFSGPNKFLSSMSSGPTDWVMTCTTVPLYGVCEKHMFGSIFYI